MSVQFHRKIPCPSLPSPLLPFLLQSQAVKMSTTKLNQLPVVRVNWKQMLSEMHETTNYCWRDNYSKRQQQWDALKTWNQKGTTQNDTQNKGRKRSSTETTIWSFKTRAAMKTMYSYLHPYLQRREQPVRERRNQKFSVSELDLKVHKENR